MSKTKYRFTYDEVRVLVIALVELKNQLIAEGTALMKCIFLAAGRESAKELLELLDGCYQKEPYAYGAGSLHLS